MIVCQECENTGDLECIRRPFFRWPVWLAGRGRLGAAGRRAGPVPRVPAVRFGRFLYVCWPVVFPAGRLGVVIMPCPSGELCPNAAH